MIWRLVVIVAAVIALASLAGCESTQETSQRLSLNAKKLLNEEGLKITKRNAQIKAVSVASIKDQYGTAVVVNLKNSGPTQLNVPIAIALIGKKKKNIWNNSTPGLDTSLISAGVVEKGNSFWINNQIDTNVTPRRVTAKVGASSERPKGPMPVIKLSDQSFKDDSSGIYLSGEIKNESKIVQKRLVISCVSLSGNQLKAAGRGIIDVLRPAPTPKPVRFRVYLIGNPKGGKVQCLAPPTTLTGDTAT